MPRALVTLLIASCCAEESIWLRRKHWVWADATNQILVPGCSHEDAMTRQWTAELTAIMCPALPLDAACADRAAATLSAARSAASSAAREPWTVRRDALTFADTYYARIVRRDGAGNRSLTIEWPWYVRDIATWACARLIARNLCATELQQRSCELERCADAVARAVLPPLPPRRVVHPPPPPPLGVSMPCTSAMP